MRQLRLYGLSLLALIVALTLTACGILFSGTEDSTDITGPVKPNLTQSLVSEQGDVGTVTLHFQDGWIGRVKDSGSIVVANTQESLDKLGAIGPGAPDPGEVYISTFVIGGTLFERFEVSPTATPLEALDSFMTRIATSDDIDPDFGEAESFNADGNPAAIASGTVIEGDKNPYGVIYVMVAVDNGIGFITFAVHVDEIDYYLELARAMAKALEFFGPGSF